jgi:NhaP-type Na+/H+ and K+/H+ antiporter
VFAFVGTIISSVVIGVLVWLVVLTGLHSLKLTLMECLMFGSILSSTDPVTILAIFNQLRVDPTLYAIIFGESMLNDAVAIVLYRCVHIVDLYFRIQWRIKYSRSAPERWNVCIHVYQRYMELYKRVCRFLFCGVYI